MNGNTYPGVYVASTLRTLNKLEGGWRMNLEYWAGNYRGRNETVPLSELVKFVIAETRPDGIVLKEADEIWMKIQKMRQW